MRVGGREQSGFTLIEIMVVSAIIGILAAIAVPQYMRFQLKSKSVEAKSNLAAIRNAQAARFSEYGTYVAAEPTPGDIPGAMAAPFAPLTEGFRELGFDSTGRVYFSYAVAVSPDGSGYTADAVANIDADPAAQYWALPVPRVSGELVEGRDGCNVSNLVAHQIGPCDPIFGQSVF